MFKIAQNPTYAAPVIVLVPAGNGRFDRQQFDAVFRRLTQAEVEQVFEALKEGKITDRELIDQVMVGWKGVGDDEGKALEFTEENKDRLLNVFPVPASIVEAFFASLREAKLKN